MARELISYVRAATMAGIGNNFFLFGPFPQNGVIRNMNVHVGNVVAGIAGTLSLVAATVSSDTLDFPTELAGQSIFESDVTGPGGPVLFIPMPTDGGTVDFDLPINRIVDSSKRFIVFTWTLAVIELCNIVTSVDVMFDNGRHEIGGGVRELVA